MEGHEVWSARQPPTAQNRSINLLKLHGSLNWYPFPEDGEGPIRLRERTFKQRGQKLYEIVPPEYVKTAGSRPIYEALRANGELALRRAEILVFAGFSFTPTDLERFHVSSDLLLIDIAQHLLVRMHRLPPLLRPGQHYAEYGREGKQTAGWAAVLSLRPNTTVESGRIDRRGAARLMRPSDAAVSSTGCTTILGSSSPRQTVE